MSLIIMVIMATVIVLLAAYAGWLLRQLAQQRRARQDDCVVQYPVPPARNEHQLGHRESIEILARCLVQEQVSATEAAIRITAIARALPESDSSGGFYNAFFDLANATAHIPILDAWQALGKVEKKSFEAERQSIEKAHRTQIMAAAHALLTLQ